MPPVLIKIVILGLQVKCFSFRVHNRCRMIVASYLVKNLICDWRWGECAFVELVVDGGLAANNGGWQWSASSGMDPKPLHIFNPATQASKFDSAGDYIRQGCLSCAM